MEYFLKQLDDIKSFESALTVESRFNNTSVPVFFTVYNREITSQFGPAGNYEIDEQYITDVLATLNDKFSGTGIQFYQLGDINYIDINGVTHNIFSFAINEISTISSALNVIIHPSSQNSYSSTSYPFRISPDFPIFENPEDAIFSNQIRLASFFTPANVGITLSHEVGHNYGLFHTFEGAQEYNAPSPPGIPTPGALLPNSDHPYGYITYPENQRTGLYRELVIREDDNTKIFPIPNATDAGDYIVDTPAFCGGVEAIIARNYPAIADENCTEHPFPASCNGCEIEPLSTDPNGDGDLNNDCDFLYSPTKYLDYNGDPLENTSIGLHNIMSYTPCRNTFTQGQINRMQFFNQGIRSVQYNPNRGINVRDEVFFEDTDTPMKGVVIKSQHTNDFQFTNTVSQVTGGFQAVYYSDQVKSRLFKLGSNPPMQRISSLNAFNNSINNSYNYQDWLDGVTVLDMLAIRKHILQTAPFDNGYDYIAADVNNSGHVSTYDLITIGNLLLGNITSFSQITTFPHPYHKSPWVFIPEYVSVLHANEFHSNPFNMTIGGSTFTNDAPYIRAYWEYPVTDGMNGLNGFDGVKIGDVNGSSALIDCPDHQVDMYNPTLININRDRSIKVEIFPTDDAMVSAWQLCLRIDSDKLEVVDLVANDIFTGFSTEHNVGWAKYTSDGILPILWIPMSLSEVNDSPQVVMEASLFENFVNLSPRNMTQKNPIITIFLESKEPLDNLDDYFSLSNFLPTKIFDEHGCPLEVQLETKVSLIPSSAGLMANEPDDNRNEAKHFYEVENFTCYPNPSTHGPVQGRYKSANEGIVKIAVNDLLGRVVYTQQLRVSRGINTFEIDATNFPTGLLWITLETSDELFTQQIARL